MNIIVVPKKRSNNPNTIYVGRLTMLGNPFSHLNLKYTIKCETAEEAIQRYKEWLAIRILTSSAVRDALHQIINVGKEHGTVHLACGCRDETKQPLPSDHICHADVIRNTIMTHLAESE